MNTWILVTDEKWAGPLQLGRQLDSPVIAVVLGPHELAEAVASAGPAEVLWNETSQDIPAEDYAQSLADKASLDRPDVVVTGNDPAARALIGAIAARLGAPLIPGAVSVTTDDARVMVTRSALGGAVRTVHPIKDHVAVIQEDEETSVPMADTPTPITPLRLEPSGMRLVRSENQPQANGLADAHVVVSFGRGVRAKEDINLIQQLADALGGEIACSMPIADDLGWLPKERYVGRSGQQISPALYLAVGIDGAPQHLEGVRGAKIVAAINNNPDARIFRRADYGIVGDLYEIIPALIEAVTN